MQRGITPPPTPIGRLDLPANYHYELPQHASDCCTIFWCKDTPGAIEDPPLVHYELPSKQLCAHSPSGKPVGNQTNHTSVMNTIAIANIINIVITWQPTKLQ